MIKNSFSLFSKVWFHWLASLLLNERYPFIKYKYDLLHVSDLNSVLKILSKYGTTTSIGGRDSTIIYSMNHHEVKDIITNDRGFENVEFIHVHNPLKWIKICKILHFTKFVETFLIYLSIPCLIWCSLQKSKKKIIFEINPSIWILTTIFLIFLR